MTRSPSVLIVEPSADEREVLRTVLERRGLRIWEAAGVERGLELAREHHPDVIVLDAEANRTGDESIQAEFDATSTDQHSSLIVLGRISRDRSLPAGQVIAKPYHFGPLIHKIEQLAGKAAGRLLASPHFGRPDACPTRVRMATLFVMQGRDKGKRFDLRGDDITVGRDGSNRIQLNDSEVSRRHAEVRRTPEGIVLADLASSNGTFVNLEKIDQRLLKNGDRVQIGRTLFLFTDADDRSSVNLAHDVDIVGLGNVEGSRILKSVSHESGSQLFAPPDPAESPWLARARSNLQVMYRTALAVSHTLDIDQLLSRILDLIFEWVEADRGCIMLVDHETEELAPTASRNRKGVRVDGKLSISRTILDYVMQHKEGVLTSDARDDQRWNPEGSIVKLGVREAICVPMQGRYGIVGVIYIDTYTPPGQIVQQRANNKFSEEHLKLMVAIGHQAALAVEDTSYYSAMVQAERLAAMGQTIATLSHHIKNILQGIRGGSYLIEEGLKEEDNEVVRRGWRIVDKNQERISNLVMDMLTFSKDREPELVPADLNETLADVVELMQARAAEAQVQLEFQRRDGLPQFQFDPDLLHKAVLNVVTNAIDACEKREAARVEVSVEHEPGARFVHIVVADNGEGIAAEDLTRIFSVFESKKGSRGTGLGLPVSQKIMREHGGDIRVESTPAVGSRFYLELPTGVSAAVNQTQLP